MGVQTTCKSADCRRWAHLNEKGYCPKCQSPNQSTEEAEDDDEATCSHCQEKIVEEVALACDCCLKWFAIKCVGSSKLKEILIDTNDNVILGDLKWFCTECTVTFTKVCKMKIKRH